jgi:hypothetical protein
MVMDALGVTFKRKCQPLNRDQSSNLQPSCAGPGPRKNASTFEWILRVLRLTRVPDLQIAGGRLSVLCSGE